MLVHLARLRELAGVSAARGASADVAMCGLLKLAVITRARWPEAGRDARYGARIHCTLQARCTGAGIRLLAEMETGQTVFRAGESNSASRPRHLGVRIPQAGAPRRGRALAGWSLRGPHASATWFLRGRVGIHTTRCLAVAVALRRTDQAHYLIETVARLLRVPS